MSTSTGTWSNSPTGHAYQWRRCDSAGGACASIAGATGTQHVLVSGDVGNTLRVVVTASNSAGSASATSNASPVVASAPAPSAPLPPANTTLPAITGTPQEGLVLSASTGSWSNSPTGYARQWRRCDSSGGTCVSIVGATGAQYTLGSADVSKTLRVTVTASNAVGSSSATSNVTAVIAAAPVVPPPPPPPPALPPVNSGPPAITGTPQEGLVLTASSGNWLNSPTAYAYQWRRCDSSGGACAPIGGATAGQYTLGSDDPGRTLRVAVTASNDAGLATATSASSPVVAPKPAPPPPPSPSGGTTLTFTDTTWTCTRPVASLATNGLPLRVVMNYTHNYNGFGVRLGSGCTGDGTNAIDLVVNVNGDGLNYGPQEDAIRVMNALPGASNLQITGYANCGRRVISSIHQDGIQVLGGTNITWVNFMIGDYDAGRSTCQGAGGAFFYSLPSNNTRVEGGKFIACNHSLLAGNGTGHVTGASFRSGRNDGSDPVCSYASSDPCLFQSSNITRGPGVTCQRWNAVARRWDDR